MIYAVIDTNVLISSMISLDEDSPTIAIIGAIEVGRIKPVYSDALLSEYNEVLHRDKFHIDPDVADLVLMFFREKGVHFEPTDEYVLMPDPDDVPIYLIALQTRDLDSYLVTGNTKHFPRVDFVVTPRKMIDLINTAY